ncbi:MAG: hypothetical protein AMJ46_12985 [Latescibacteria bacterium DG_63]|nr:MAG: hypothetical protein AMJ46_12985 [Latescibacteria bacterium DG_63]
MDNAVLVVYLLLFTVTGGAVFVYYRRIREGSREYAKSKSVLEDVVLSFNRDLEGHSDRIAVLEEHIEGSRIENLRILEGVRSEVMGIKGKVEDLVRTEQGLRENHETLRRRIDEFALGRTKIPDTGVVESLVGGDGISSVASERPSVFIRKDRALAPLTETELRILELLAAEGEKTAPQIRGVIKLTREHTARLMKKLYVSGYVERRTANVPYSYRLKKEMRELLSIENGKI